MTMQCYKLQPDWQWVLNPKQFVINLSVEQSVCGCVCATKSEQSICGRDRKVHKVWGGKKVCRHTLYSLFLHRASEYGRSAPANHCGSHVKPEGREPDVMLSCCWSLQAGGSDWRPVNSGWWSRALCGIVRIIYTTLMVIIWSSALQGWLGEAKRRRSREQMRKSHQIRGHVVTLQQRGQMRQTTHEHKEEN